MISYQWKEDLFTLCGHTDGICPFSPLIILLFQFVREHDKGPEEFSELIKKLLETRLEFRLSILGTHTQDIPGNLSIL